MKHVLVACEAAVGNVVSDEDLEARNDVAVTRRMAG